MDLGFVSNWEEMVIELEEEDRTTRSNACFMDTEPERKMLNIQWSGCNYQSHINPRITVGFGTVD